MSRRKILEDFIKRSSLRGAARGNELRRLAKEATHEEEYLANADRWVETENKIILFECDFGGVNIIAHGDRDALLRMLDLASRAMKEE